MQVRCTQSLSCPRVPWPASKHNDDLVQRALNCDGHLSHSRWWKRCAVTAQTERWVPSCLTHTERDSFHHFSSWLYFKMESDSSCDPNSLPLLFFFHFCFSLSLSLLTCTHISFTVSDLPMVLTGSGPDWRRKGGVSGSGLRSSPSWDRERTNRASFTPCCYSCLLLSYTCIHTHTLAIRL